MDFGWPNATIAVCCCCYWCRLPLRAEFRLKPNDDGDVAADGVVDPSCFAMMTTMMDQRTKQLQTLLLSLFDIGCWLFSYRRTTVSFFCSYSSLLWLAADGQLLVLVLRSFWIWFCVLLPQFSSVASVLARCVYSCPAD